MISRYDLATAVEIAARHLAPDGVDACAERLRLVAVPALLQWCPTLDNPWRVAAVLCWCDLVGAGRLERSGLRVAVNARNWPGAAIEIRRRVRSRGQIDPDQFEARAALAEMMDGGGRPPDQASSLPVCSSSSSSSE